MSQEDVMRATVSIVMGVMLAACGGTASEQTGRVSQRIVGGSQSTSAQDSAVYLSIGEDGSCSGTLISKNLVLTARHCVSHYGWGGSELCGEFEADLPASSVSIHLGVDAQWSGAVARGKKIYRPSGNDGCDDIALVELDTLVTQVPPAAVRFTTPTIGEPTTAVGYGEDGFGSIPDKRWQRANLPLTAIGPTAFDYVTRRGWSLPVEVPGKTIVTGESTCYGDSGGPLFDSKGAVIGITSRGVDDHCVDRPTLYTATASFETLIRSAAASAGQPLVDEVKPPTIPPTEVDPEPEEREESRTRPAPSRDTDDENEGLDEPSAEEPLPEPAACSASPKRSTHAPSLALVALAAVVVLAIRRRQTKTATISASLMMAACSSTPPYEGTPLAGSDIRDDEATDDDLDRASLEDPGGNPSSSSSSGSSAKGACSGEASENGCFECCKRKAPAAVELYTQALEGCLSQSPGACKEACADTLCSGFKADSACAACLRDSGSSCEDTAFAKCESDSSCRALLDCATESKCSAK
jgi:hypothetical protein